MAWNWAHLDGSRVCRTKRGELDCSIVRVHAFECHQYLRDRVCAAMLHLCSSNPGTHLSTYSVEDRDNELTPSHLDCTFDDPAC